MAEPTVQQLIDMYSTKPRTEVEMEGAVVRSQIPKPVYRDGVNLDVSMVGDKFVHIGKLSELENIIGSFSPSYKELGRRVDPSMRAVHSEIAELRKRRAAEPDEYKDGKIVAYGSGVGTRHTNDPMEYYGMDVLTPVGVGAFLVVGASAGKDEQGNDIPIIVYQDSGKIGEGKRAIGAAGPYGGDPALGYRYPSAEDKSYFTSGVDGFGFHNQYIVPRSKIIDYPFDPSANVGLEASRNYGQDFSERIAPKPIPPPPVLAPMPPPAPRPFDLEDPPIRNTEYRSPFRTMYRKGY